MNDDVLAFLEKWVEDNVVPIDASLRAEKAELLAERFYREAADAGFEEADVEQTVQELADGEDLASYLEAKLENVDDEEDVEDD